MTETFTVPANTDELNAIATAFAANGWKLSAAVYAHTYDGDDMSNPDGIAPDGRMSAWRFATLGIRGLRDEKIVRRHRQIWKLAIADGVAEPADKVHPVAVPDVDWHEYNERAAGRWTVPALSELTTTTQGAEQSEKRPSKERQESDKPLPSILFNRRKAFESGVNRVGSRQGEAVPA